MGKYNFHFSYKIIFFVVLLFFLSFSNIYAEENERYITIVNPVRISRYAKTPAKSLKSEYQAINKYNFAATWLLTYDALEDVSVINEIKKMDKYQEYGVFLEVTQTFAKDAEIEYHDTGFWHHASGVFLSGYSQEERVILIDKLFEKYKEVFGTYPRSIGSWWTDGYSLSYIKEKYGVVANLVCSDQYSTDGYQIWGQPWQVPYYPRKTHPAVPASSEENKLDLINIQWASRDPLNGYQSSLYSTQDYLVSEKTQDISYFEKLLDLYLNTKELSQIVVGLEADLDFTAYSGEFLKQIDVVKKYSDKGVKVITMSQFYDRYKNRYPDISPITSIESSDLLNSEVKSFWYNSPTYRLHYIIDTLDNSIQIKDLRVYGESLIDPYYFSPNNEFNLSIKTPSIIDSIENLEDIWKLPKNSRILPSQNGFIIKGSNVKIPKTISNNPLIDVSVGKNEVEIKFKEIVFDEIDGNTIEGFTSEALHFFKTKKSLLKLLSGSGWNYFEKIEYLIPQGEVYALLYLQALPQGKVMIFDNECLQCVWHTNNKPIFFANLRNYVKKYSKHPIIYNSSVLKAKTIEEAQKEFKKARVKYVYLVKFEEYREKLPFSPGDLGVKRIYSNANAEIWEVE